MQLNVFLFSLYTPERVENALRSQQLLIVMLWSEHLFLNMLYCLVKFLQYSSALTSSSDSVSMTSCVMIFIAAAAAVGDNVW